MKKVLTVLLCAGLAMSLTMLISVNNQKNALLRKENSAAEEHESIRAQYDDAKAQLEQTETARKQLSEENAALKKDKAALEEKIAESDAALQTLRTEAASLVLAEQTANEALETARQEWEQQRQALTAEKEDAANRLTEALAVLLPGVPEADEPQPPEAENLFASQGPEETEETVSYEASPKEVDAAESFQKPEIN